MSKIRAPKLHLENSVHSEIIPTAKSRKAATAGVGNPDEMYIKMQIFDISTQTLGYRENPGVLKLVPKT